MEILNFHPWSRPKTYSWIKVNIFWKAYIQHHAILNIYKLHVFSEAMHWSSKIRLIDAHTCGVSFVIFLVKIQITAAFPLLW